MADIGSWMDRQDPLIHWGRVTHICVSYPTITGSDNGLSPGRRQAIILINAGKLLIGPLETNVSDILIEIHTFSFQENAFGSVIWKMAAIMSRPQCINNDDMAITKQNATHPCGYYMVYYESCAVEVGIKGRD